MNNKLTLRMDESLIASAKDYAAAHGSSVSQMVANYFAALAQTSGNGTQASSGPSHTQPDKAANVSGPVTRRLSGLLNPQGRHHSHLERKHLDTPEEKSL